MNNFILESMKLLTSISISEKASAEMKTEANQRLMTIFEILDEDLALEKEQIEYIKTQRRVQKFGITS